MPPEGRRQRLYGSVLAPPTGLPRLSWHLFPSGLHLQVTHKAQQVQGCQQLLHSIVSVSLQTPMAESDAIGQRADCTELYVLNTQTFFLNDTLQQLVVQ